MHIYQVGGAVRDRILGVPSQDTDYVVTGATESELGAAGFKKVGKCFPVFLHPETGEEYAMARKEVKTGRGHQDFKFIFTPDITLEEDALRRDFTCNALYYDPETHEIIDYHHGLEDIGKHVLRHISPHFAEDPLRILRMCRFAAQLGFSVAPETMELCRKMVHNGDLAHLSPVRIWREMEKALCSRSFYKFILAARECGALAVLLPEVEALWQIPEREDYHPEKNSGVHTLLALKAAQTNDALVNFTVLFHDIGKSRTDKARWPSHRGHNKLGAEMMPEILRRLNVPASYGSFAVLTIANHMVYHQNIAEKKLEIAEVAVALANRRQESCLERFLAVLKADMLGRAMSDFTKYLAEFAVFEQYLRRLYKAARLQKVSEMPGFPALKAEVENGCQPPSAIREAYVKMLVEENPPPDSDISSLCKPDFML